MKRKAVVILHEIGHVAALNMISERVETAWIKRCENGDILVGTDDVPTYETASNRSDVVLLLIAGIAAEWTVAAAHERVDATAVGELARTDLDRFLDTQHGSADAAQLRSIGITPNEACAAAYKIARAMRPLVEQACETTLCALYDAIGALPAGGRITFDTGRELHAIVTGTMLHEKRKAAGLVV